MTWNILGSINVDQNWKDIYGTITKRSIKVRFAAADFDRVSSFVRIRGIYDSGAVTPTVTVYPDNRLKIIEIPWSEEVVQSGDSITGISARKFILSRTRQFQRNDLDYSILLEALE